MMNSWKLLPVAVMAACASQPITSQIVDLENRYVVDANAYAVWRKTNGLDPAITLLDNAAYKAVLNARVSQTDTSVAELHATLTAYEVGLEARGVIK